MKKIVSATSILFIILVACTPEYPFVSKEEVQELMDSRDPFRRVGNVVAVIDNDVYYFKRIDSIPRRLTNTPTKAKSKIELSYDKTKIAYLDENGSPVIINAVSGELIEAITSLTSVKQMGWTNQDKSLYVLKDNKVFIHGATTKIINPFIQHPYDNVTSFSMNNIGDQAYAVNYYGVGKRIEFNSADGKIEETIKVFPDEVTAPSYIDFLGNKGSFIVGYRADESKPINKVSCFNDYAFWSDRGWSGPYMTTPVYDQTFEVLLYGGSGTNGYAINAVYLGTTLYHGDGPHEIMTKRIDAYASKTQIYLDWKP